MTSKKPFATLNRLHLGKFTLKSLKFHGTKSADSTKSRTVSRNRWNGHSPNLNSLSTLELSHHEELYSLEHLGQEKPSLRRQSPTRPRRISSASRAPNSSRSGSENLNAQFGRFSRRQSNQRPPSFSLMSLNPSHP